MGDRCVMGEKHFCQQQSRDRCLKPVLKGRPLTVAVRICSECSEDCEHALALNGDYVKVPASVNPIGVLFSSLANDRFTVESNNLLHRAGDLP